MQQLKISINSVFYHAIFLIFKLKNSALDFVSLDSRFF